MQAVLHWRTGQTDPAKENFRRAAEQDPVWMQAKWVENTFTPATAGILHKLQALEQERRRLAELRAGKKPL
jgi:hypothetical protein